MSEQKRPNPEGVLVDERPVVLELANLSVTFNTDRGPLRAIDDFNLKLHEGEFVTVVGPSGCGKSTLLGVVSGLVSTYEGEVTLPKRGARDLGYVFQRDSLLPWRTTLDNLTIALELRGVGKREREDRAREYLSKLGLEGFGDYYPRQLSGGMRQRIAIGRTLIYEPRVVLMDEPFGALDAQTKGQMQELFLEIWSEHRPSVIFITHDLAESIYLAERVVVMTGRPGRVKRVMTVDIERPRPSPFEVWKDDAFRDLYTELWGELQEEI
ncbi:MAG: transporter related protein [Rhodoglobus sp.]|nr:transporter related protein [Rhodoglobus sp.]